MESEVESEKKIKGLYGAGVPGQEIARFGKCWEWSCWSPEAAAPALAG